MKRKYAALAAAALICAHGGAFGQTYKDRGGSKVPGTTVFPYAYMPVLKPGCVLPATPACSTAQYGLAVTVATHLTIPDGARYATACVETEAIRYTMSGATPTSSIGMQLQVGNCIAIEGADMIATFQAISATGTINVEFYQ